MSLLLDDKIYLLQKTTLPQELAKQVIQADLFYLKNKDQLAENILNSVERECAERGIPLPYNENTNFLSIN